MIVLSTVRSGSPFSWWSRSHHSGIGVGIVSPVRRVPVVATGHEFESLMGLAMNWWAKAYRFANFPLGCFDIDIESEELIGNLRSANLKPT